MAQWLSLYVSTAEGPGSVPGQEMKVPHTAGCSQKEKNRKKIKKKKVKAVCLAHFACAFMLSDPMSVEESELSDYKQPELWATPSF